MFVCRLLILSAAVAVVCSSASQEDLLKHYYYSLVNGEPPPPPAGATMEEVIHFDPETIHSAPLVAVPRDKDDPRYVQSFAVNRPNEYVEFYKQYGFVVIRDVLSPETCEQSISEIWDYIEDRGFEIHRWLPPAMVARVNQMASPEQLGRMINKPPITRDDPSSWYNDWPPLDSAGIVGALPVFTKQALLNRQNPNIYKAFSHIMGRKDLMVSHDRLGLFRPLRNKNNRLVKSRREKWKTAYSLHWDLNPWRHTLEDDFVMVQGTRQAQESVKKLQYVDPGDFFLENNEIGLESEPQINTQGLLNLADNLEEDGGFHLVVGFQKHLASWSKTTRNIIAPYFLDKNFVPIHGKDPMYKQPQRVPMRAGSLLIWDQRVAHGSRPNNSTQARYVQFVKMFPAIDLSTERAMYRGQLIKDKVEMAGVELTELGKKLFALKPWK